MEIFFPNMVFTTTCFLLLTLSDCASSHASKKFESSSKQVIKGNVQKGCVVIDPGHGGNDAGAISKRGLLEKNLTLDIAYRLRRLILRHLPQVEVILTRKKDEYVSLEDRIAVANRRPCQLFLSLHINSSETKEASGFEFYSLDVASDRHAERLAARENKDLSKTSGVNFILADLRAFSNRKDSDRLGQALAFGLNGQLKKLNSNISNRGYNQAIFRVLFVKMPAILAELFFISNPQEERMLSEKSAREIIAQGLFVGVRNFLANNSMRTDHAQRR
jgi:N-acetylmuramoyl-L-alanine amidase